MIECKTADLIINGCRTQLATTQPAGGINLYEIRNTVSDSTVCCGMELSNPLISMFMGRRKPEGAKAACSITEYYNDAHPVGYGLFCLIQIRTQAGGGIESSMGSEEVCVGGGALTPVGL